MSANCLVGLEPTRIRTKCYINDWKRTMTIAHGKTRQHRTSGRNGKDGRPSRADVIFVVMDALVNVLAGEVLILHCHENSDCQEPDDRHSERLRV